MVVQRTEPQPIRFDGVMNWPLAAVTETTMKLLLKFNLVFVLIFLLGLVATGAMTRRMLERNAQQETLQQARLLLEKALAVRSYTLHAIGAAARDADEVRLPAAVGAGLLGHRGAGQDPEEPPRVRLQGSHAEPDQPARPGAGVEADVIAEFRKSAELKEFVGERDTPAGRALYIARPIRIADGACLRCHSTVETAPRTLVEKYGPANGFGWQLGEGGRGTDGVGADGRAARAHAAWALFMGMLSAVFVLIAVALNAMLWWLVIRR